MAEKTTTIGVRVPVSFRDAVEEAASVAGVSFADLVRQAVVDRVRGMATDFRDEYRDAVATSKAMSDALENGTWKDATLYHAHDAQTNLSIPAWHSDPTEGEFRKWIEWVDAKAALALARANQLDLIAGRL